MWPIHNLKVILSQYFYYDMGMEFNIYNKLIGNYSYLSIYSYSC